MGRVVEKNKGVEMGSFYTQTMHTKYTTYTQYFLQEAADFAIKFELSTENTAITTITTLIYKQDTKNNAIS